MSSHQGGEKSRGPVVGLGIDFGTTNSAAAVAYADGSTEVLPLDPLPDAQGTTQNREAASASGHDPRLFPTLLYFPGRTEAYFGSQAVSQYFDRDREGRFFQSIKKLLPNSEFQGTAIHGKFVSIEELIARFLTELRLRVERVLGAPLGELPVVFGRPARYSAEPGAEGLAVVRFKKACELSGFHRPRFLEEPLAAAKIYQADSALGDHSVLIADLGGGTSDFTLMEFSEDEGCVAHADMEGTGACPDVAHAKTRARARILASHGISVAGDALDSAFFVARLNPLFGTEVRYQRPFSENVLTFPVAFARLLPKWHHHAFLKEKSVWNFLKQLRRELVDPGDCTALENLINLVEDNLGYALHAQVERLKKDLSQSDLARFVFRSYPIDLEFEVSRAEYEQMVAPSAQLIADAAIETMRQARVEPSSVARISFTGGTSKVPLVRKQILAKFTNAREAEQDTFTSVAVGLAQDAAKNRSFSANEAVV